MRSSLQQTHTEHNHLCKCVSGLPEEKYQIPKPSHKGNGIQDASPSIGGTRVRTGIFFFFRHHFRQFDFFAPFSLTLSQILSQILAIIRQKIILSEKGVRLLISIIAAVDSRISIV